MLHDADLDLADGLQQFADAMQAQERERPPPLFRPVGTRQPRAEGLDLCSPAGAQALATRLRDFWAAAGFKIEISVFPVAHSRQGSADRRSVMAIRSNLVGALPPRQGD